MGRKKKRDRSKKKKHIGGNIGPNSDRSKTSDQEKSFDNLGRKTKKHHALNIIFLLGISLIAVCFIESLNAEKFVVSKLFRLLPSKPSNIAIVEINDGDYQKYFHAQSPLSKEMLREIVIAILKNEPKVLGVAIDTSDSRYADFEIPDSPTPIVWATLPVLSKDGELDHIKNSLGDQDSDRPEGLAVLPQDNETNALCCYQKFEPVSKSVFEETFEQRLLGEYEPSFKNVERSADQYYLKFNNEDQNKQRVVMGIARLFSLSESENSRTENPLKNKIVILGGSYRGQEKIFPTYGGNYKGYEIHAAAIETDLDGIHLQPTPWYFRILIDIIFGFVSIVIFHIYEKQFGIAVMISICIFFILSLSLSLLRYNNFYGVIQYLPTLLFLLIAKVTDYLYYKELLVHYLFDFYGKLRIRVQ
jgi:CHASE2 domain-containing sensor protein